MLHLQLIECRGRDDGYPTPPAQNPYVHANAYGSYLECVTENRSSGHGCRMVIGGQQQLAIRSIRSH